MAPKDPSVSNIPQLDKGALKRVLGVLDLFAIGYGDLGSSIYYALGVTAFFALGATPIAMVLAGFVFVCTALSYAEMSAAFHESGGSASYARHAFNDLVSFIAGWGLLLDYIVTIAIAAFTIGPYLMTFFPALKEPDVQILFTIGLIVLILALNIAGVKQSTRTSLLLMLFTVITQSLIILIGLFTAENLTKVISDISIGGMSPDSPSWGEFLKGTAMAMVAYTGIESIAQLSSETKKPVRSVPRAIMLTMGVVLFMYLGLTVIGFSILTPTELGQTYESQPIAGIVANFPWGAKFLLPWVGVLAAITLFVSANAGLIGASRLSFNMGEYYQLPRFFHKIHPKFRTPYLSLAFFALIACVVVAVSRARLSFLADLYNFGAQIAFFFTQMSLIMLRIKKPHMIRPFKVPLNIKIKGKEIPVPAVLGALASFSVWTMVVITKPDGRYVGISWILLGVLMYWIYRRGKKISPTTQVVIQKIKIPRFEPLEIKRILLPLRSTTQTETVQIACELAKMHKGKITALHVIEVPFSVPLDTVMPHRLDLASRVLKTAEAIALDQGIELEMDIVRARSVSDAIIDILSRNGYDLLLLESTKVPEKGGRQTMGALLTELIQRAPCRTWVCNSSPTENTASLAEIAGINK
ncbi:MAG: amino acid permease [Verrucomicrobia bacterium]|nr:amino acid permease [Verrucomicrobiota bacterium]